MNPGMKREDLERTVRAYEQSAGNLSATARRLGIDPANVRRRLQRIGKYNKPMAAGSVRGRRERSVQLPPEGQVKRYVLTSAQNNTYVHEKAWTSLLALAKHYRAEILVGTFSYNQNQFGPLAVKRGKKGPYEKELWYAPEVVPFISDARLELGRGLVWCGEMNILPTAVNPLTGLETYSARRSAIFPHVKLAMRSIPAMAGEGVKLNYTTGTVTKRNYIQKREGLVAEHHHVYGGLLVEVDHRGHWWVRQLNADREGAIQDLDVVARGDEVTTGNPIEAINWGDLHATFADEAAVEASLDLLDALKPRQQFLHDVLEGSAINHHRKSNPHFKFYTWLRGLHRLDTELERTARVMARFARPWAKAVVVDSNHDDPWIQRWLREYDYRWDPPNAELFLKAQAHLYAQLRAGKMARDVNMLEWCLREVGLKMEARFLVADESYLICNKSIECGMHGHLGPDGAEGTPANLSKMGRKANTSHTHSAGIYNGLYVAGTLSRLRWDYNKGPSTWTHSHVVTYPNGKRTVVTIYNGAWRA